MASPNTPLAVAATQNIGVLTTSLSDETENSENLLFSSPEIETAQCNSLGFFSFITINLSRSNDKGSMLTHSLRTPIR